MKATIVSIYPLERRHFLPRHTKRNTYILPAAEPGTFIKDVVDDPSPGRSSKTSSMTMMSWTT
jgi:hypothetical protein